MSIKRKLIVTGANGFVAGSVLAQAGAEWEVHAMSRGEPLVQRDQLCWHTCDPLSPEQLTRLFATVKPDAVIHTAALADVDFCQAHPELARRANVDLPRALAEQCRDSGAKLVFCSTDTVFNGEHAPYQEEDPTQPLNVYAETKVAAEQFVTRLAPYAVVARSSLVIGLPIRGAGNSFLARMLTSLQAGQLVAATPDETRTPVDVVTLGRALLELAAGKHTGIFHVAGHDRLTRFEIAQRIAACFGFPRERIFAQAVATWTGRAARPRDVSLANAKVSAQLQTPMLTLADALALIRKTSGTPAL